MRSWKSVLKAALYPPFVVLLLLLPISAVLLIGSLLHVGETSFIAYLSYALSAYTLTVWCLKIPWLIRFFKQLKDNNRYVKRWFSDTQLRVNVMLYGALVWNIAYALFQLWLGFYHGSFWFYALAAYYTCLALMRFSLVRHTRKYAARENMRQELVQYRACGWVFLLMNLALGVITFFMVYWDRTFHHHEITTITLAAYTFASFSMAIVNVVKYRKYNSPIFSAAKIISFTAACVSMLTLESTMLTTFGGETMDTLTRKILLGASGGAIFALVLAMAVFMIVSATKRLQTENKVKEE